MQWRDWKTKMNYRAVWHAWVLMTVLCLPGTSAFTQSVDSKIGQAIEKFFAEAVATDHKDLAESVSRALNDRNFPQAVNLLKKASQQEDAAALPSAQELLRSLQQAKPEDIPHQTFFVQDSSGKLHPVSLSPAEQVHVRALNEMHVPWTRRTFVTRAAKQFVDDIRYGAQNADALIAACRAEWTCPERKLVENFMKAPPEQRVFVIGSGVDTPFAAGYAKAREALGEKVFFYRDCLTAAGHLCNSNLVGAMMARSGDCVVLDSANTALSEYVFPEVAAALRLRQGQSLMIMIPQEDMPAAAGSLQYAAVKSTVTTYIVSQN